MVPVVSKHIYDSPLSTGTSPGEKGANAMETVLKSCGKNVPPNTLAPSYCHSVFCEDGVFMPIENE